MKKLLIGAKVKVIVSLICLFNLQMLVASTHANVVISEIMYHPPQLWDEYYEFLELYNTGASEVNLANWKVDGIGFTFPAGATIGPSAYLVLARDANLFQATYGFMPNYTYSDGKLSNSGELLRVLDANGVAVDEVGYSTYPPWPVTPDEEGPSLERINPTLNGNTPRNWHASIAAAKHTAGAINSVNAAGLPPWISNVQHGTVQQGTPITVTAVVESANTVNLKYIINFGTSVIIAMHDDGLSGDGAAGDGVYGATISAQPLNTLIRYRIDTTGATGVMGLPRDDDSVIYTGTYIENDASVITGMPIVHWLIDPCDYTKAVATCLTDANYSAFVYYKGTLYDVNIHARGQTSRSWYKKSWKFKTARNHDFFMPGLTGIPVDNFNMQASYSDKSYTRENLAWNLFADVGSPYSQYFPVRLYQNGQFFGLYAYYEDIDNNYLTRNGLDKDYGALYEAASDCSYYPLAQLPTYYEKHRPDDGDFNDLYNFLNGINNLTGQARRNFIFDNLNIPEVMNYLAALVAMHDNDAVAKNYYLYRDTAGTKRWWILPWDKDLTWGRNYDGAVLNDEIWANIDSIVGRTNVSPSHPLFGDYEHEKYDYLWNRLIEVLYNETDYRNMFFRRLRTIMDEQLQEPNTPYAQRKIEKRVDELTAIEDTEAAMDMSKWESWGQYQTISEAAQILKDSYLAVRRTHLFVTHRVANEIPTAQTSGLPIIINEIMYNPTGGDNDEFIELYNPSSTESVDMSDWQLDGVELTFPPGTVLLPQSYLVVVKNDVQFRTTYGSGHFVAAQYDGSLDNAGENLILTDRQDNVIDEVYYSSGRFWPTLSGGRSLELIDASRNNNHPVNWAASASTSGTPGAANSKAGTSPYIPELKVNEVLPVNGSINTDDNNEYAPWIEIYNDSPNSINLGGMYLTNDYNNPAKWAIPVGTILNSDQWMIIWADAEPNEGPLHTNFALSAGGGSVGLYTADSNIIDYLDYGALATNISYGKYPDGVAACREFGTPTPAAQNYIVPTPLILNEYTGVADNKYLKDSGSDTYWGTVMGNGGDWFELVVTQDHLDARGWQLVLSDNGVSKTLTLTSNSLWADLRSGTIITVSENLPDNISNYDPANGKWWINVQAKTGASGTYITATNIDVSQNNWQLTIKDSNSIVVFGPAGEGIKPASGIGSDEIFHLGEDPASSITPRSNYTDGSASTFGAPNIDNSGKVQDLSNLRNIPDAGAPAPNPMTWIIAPTTTSSTSITMIAIAASDPTGVEYYFNNVTDPNHDSGWQNGTYYKDKNLQSNTTYTYRVKARDKSAAQNETAWSGNASAITPLLLSPPASGTVDSNLSSSARTSATFSHTVAAGSNRLLVVSVMIRGDKSVSSVTYAGNALTKSIFTASGASSGCAIEIWYLVAPPVGTANVVVNFAASVDPSGITAVNFTGVNQSSPVGAVSAANATSGTNITTNITTRDVNSLVFGAATTYGGDTDPFTPGSGITEMWDNATGTSTTSDNGIWGGKRTTTTPGVYTFNTTAAADDDWAIAAIEIKAAATTSPPGQASNPGPATGATNVDTNADLSWTAGDGATLHDVYFGTTNPPPFVVEQAGTTYDPGTLANGTTYYWRIDEKNAGGTTTGIFWNFTTIFRQSLTTSASTGGTVTTPGIGTYVYDYNTSASIVASASANYHFVNWTGTAVAAGKVTDPNAASTIVLMGANYTVTANFAPDKKSLTTSASSGGTVATPGIGTYVYDYNTSANIVASASANYHFVNWTGTAVTAGKVSNPNTPSTTVLMDANYTVTANFAPDKKSLTTSASSGGTVATPGIGTYVYDYNTSAGIVASASANYHFVNWTGTAVTAGKVTNPTSPTTTVTMDSDYTVVANFAIDIRHLTSSSTDGGNATVPGEGVYDYNHGDVINLEATADLNYHFVNWTGTAVDAGKVANPTSATTTVTVDSDYTVVANFAIDIRQLTSSSTDGGNVTAPGEGVYDYNHGTVVNLTATADLNYHFVSWTGSAVDAGKVASPTSATTTVTVDSDYTLVANFAIDIRQLTSSSTDGGNVTVPGEGVYDYNHGDVVNLEATADLNYHFVNWTGSAVDAGKVASPTSATTTVTVDSDYTLVANFAINQKSLTTSASVGGTVTTPGIGTYWYNYGTDVNIVAAADTGYVFVSWTGTAVTAGKVTDPNVASTTVLIDANYTVQANFALPIVPDVTGQTQADAETAIVAATFTVGDVVTACSDTVPTGRVISQDPAGSTAAPSGSAVDLVVSSGQPSVPDVTGMTEANAIAAINAVANISYGSSSTEYSNTVPAGYVISQSATGTVPCGTVVDLIVSIGRPTIRSNGTGGGDWNTGTTWIGGIVPIATDDVIIQGSDVVTLVATGSCTNLTMDAGTTLSLDANSLVIPGTSWNLAPTSTVIYNGPTTVQSAPTYGNLVYSSFANGSPNGNLTVMSNLYIDSNTLRGITTTSGTRTHNISGDVIISGTGRITAVNQSNSTSASCTWNIGGNLTLGSTYNRIQLYESAGPHTGSAVFNINGNLTVGSSSQIMLKSSSATTADYPEGIINLKGNLVQNGIIGVNSATSGTSPGLSINFVGTSPQDWSGTGSFSVTAFSVNMNINNAAGVTLSSPVKIHTNTVLILTSGNLTTTEINLLTIDKGFLSGGSSASYVNGPLAKRIALGPQNQEFPVGDATKYTPVNLAFGNVSDADIVKVSTIPGIHPQIATSRLDSSKTLNRYYTVTNLETFGFDNVTATFNFDPTDVIGGADPTKYVVKKFDSGIWTTPTTVNPLATSIQATGMTSFGDFAVGELLPTITISGHVTGPDANVPIEGVSISATNDGGSGMTDANGYYEVAVYYNWSGDVVPSKYAYAFQPSSITYVDVIEDQNEQNYVGAPLVYRVTGYVRNACQVPIEGVAVDVNDGGGSYMTDANGYYEVWVGYKWSGTLTPDKAYYTFDPSNKVYTNVLEDRTGEDYVANNIYDLDCDGSIGYGDVSVISEHWLETGSNVPGDIYKDEDNIVNFRDFSDFADVWLED